MASRREGPGPPTASGGAGKHLVLAATLTAVALALVAADDEHTFQFLLSRLLGLALVYLGWAGFLWARGRAFWNEFFTWGVLGEAAVVIVERSFLGWIPVLWPVLWLSGPALSLCFAGGLRELTKDQGWPEQQAMIGCLVGGVVLHYFFVGGLVHAVFTLLTGKYP